MNLKCQFVDPRAQTNNPSFDDSDEEYRTISEIENENNSGSISDSCSDIDKDYYLGEKIVQLFTDDEHSEFHLRTVIKPKFRWSSYNNESRGHTIESWEKRKEINIYQLCADFMEWNVMKPKDMKEFMNIAKINPGYYVELECVKNFLLSVFPDLELPQPIFKVGGCPTFSEKTEPDMHKKLEEGKYFFQIIGGDDVGTPNNIALYF